MTTHNVEYVHDAGCPAAKDMPRGLWVCTCAKSDAGAHVAPCPFCGKQPVVGPVDPEVSGNAWAYVECRNQRCPAQPRVKDGAQCCDERGSDAYKRLAIKRWNRRKAK